MRCKKTDCFTCPYPDCINENPDPIRIYTGQLQRMNNLAKKRRKARAESGMCTWCGKRTASDGRKTCPECREKLRRYKEVQTRKKGILPRVLLDGVDLCQKCGKAPPVDSYKLCQRCLDNARAHLDLTPTHNHKRPAGYFNEAHEIYWSEHKGKNRNKKRKKK